MIEHDPTSAATPPAHDRMADPPLAHLLIRLVRWFDQGVVNLLAERGHTTTKRSHAMVMRNLDPHGTSESELARRAGVSRQAIHLVVRDLLADGLVVTRDHAVDRRRRVVELTDLGRRTTTDAIEVLGLLERELTRRISTDHADALRAALTHDPGPPVAGGSAGSGTPVERAEPPRDER